jgi:GNAT superfamily N-acetyltransferase
VARRLRPLTFARAAELSDECARCRYWEEGLPASPRCASVGGRDAEEAWYRIVREEWGDPGRICFQDREALGFVKYAPTRYFRRARGPLGPGPASEDAVLLACLHVRDEARNLGLGTVLLQAALSDLTSRGERIVEAYGSVEPADSGSPFITANFLLRQGFQVVKPHPDLPLLRLELEALEAWTESFESALESLQLALTPQRVPGTSIRSGS